MAGITCDESGEFLEHAFFHLDIPFDVDRCGDAGDGCVYRESDTTDGVAAAYCEVIEESEVVGRCRVCNQVIEKKTVSRWADLLSFDYTATFVCDLFGLALCVTDAFRKLIAERQMPGVTTLESLPIKVNQTTFDDAAVFRIVPPRTSGCYRETTKTPSSPNACFKCGWSPVICSECGDDTWTCPTCDEVLIVPVSEHLGEDDRRLSAIGYPERGWILEGERWDGSDYLAGPDLGFVSSRCIEWFFEVGAAPFVGRPCRVDISRTPSNARERLEELDDVGRRRVLQCGKLT